MNSLSRNVFVVLNPVAGQAYAATIRAALARHFTVPAWQCEVYETTGQEDVAEVTRLACAQGLDLVVAAGGDGTVAGVVNGLRESGVPLGILPVGTGNGLARGLSLPLELEAALQLLAGENTLMDVDALQVGDRCFLLMVGVGISSQAVRETYPAQKRLLGLVAYVWMVLKQWLGFQPCHFTLTVDGRTRRMRASEILVLNGRMLHEPPQPLGPPETFNDSRLEAYVLTARTLFEYVRVLWNLFFNPRNRKIRLRHFAVRKRITIDSGGRKLPVQADGELIGETPVEIRLVRDAVRVVVPKPIRSV